MLKGSMHSEKNRQAVRSAAVVINNFFSQLLSPGSVSAVARDGMQRVTPGGRAQLGNLISKAGERAGDVARARGASASNVREKMGDWANVPLGSLANAAARNEPGAVTAIKIVKQGNRLGQKY
jgi:hypothetical protein